MQDSFGAIRRELENGAAAIWTVAVRLASEFRRPIKVSRLVRNQTSYWNSPLYAARERI